MFDVANDRLSYSDLLRPDVGYTLDFAVDIPKGYYDRVRVDIDGSFSLKDIFISDEDINVCNKTSLSSFGFFRFLTLFFVLGAFLVLFIYWKNSKKSESSIF